MTVLRRVDMSSSSGSGATAFGLSRRELDERTSVVSVQGELDLSTAPRLKWMLHESIEAGSSRLVVDLSFATFMDSTALGVLVGVHRRLGPSAPLAIVCPRDEVLQVFELSGTDGVFAIHPRLDDALAYVRGDTARAG